MRTSGTLFNSSPVTRFSTFESTATIAAAATPDETFSPPATIQHSPWHSPIPYLFGGLAAMLGLIAFALLILACSYWKLSGQVNGGDGDAEGGAAAAKGDGGSDEKASPVFEEKLLVIMAGEVKPTFLATPTSSRNSSFNDEKIINSQDKEKEENEGHKHQIDSDLESQLGR
ncbi:protein glutamine dumper 3 [Phtheirospermum japonicum]|uniref:Protein glutamine dumper 3 n=1 Tax=Phtheirospermum japonicum TaxID=374723 RepID=A0A830CUB7_9LAMI|nr:protein glutamine dumper 3 [Phtheirospermum japonicum]